MIGLFIGRFQPFHRGHLKAIKHLDRTYHTVIGIGSSETMNTFKNPLSFSERRTIIHTCLPAHDVFPFPDRDDDSEWVAEIDAAVDFDVIISGNDWTRDCFTASGFEVEEPQYFRRDRYRATNVRELAATGDETWKELVPPDTVEVLERFNFVQRMQDLSPGR